MYMPIYMTDICVYMIPARGPQTMFLCNICCAGTQTATSNPEILAIGS